MLADVFLFFCSAIGGTCFEKFSNFFHYTYVRDIGRPLTFFLNRVYFNVAFDPYGRDSRDIQNRRSYADPKIRASGQRLEGHHPWEDHRCEDISGKIRVLGLRLPDLRTHSGDIHDHRRARSGDRQGGHQTTPSASSRLAGSTHLLARSCSDLPSAVREASGQRSLQCDAPGGYEGQRAVPGGESRRTALHRIPSLHGSECRTRGVKHSICTAHHESSTGSSGGRLLISFRRAAAVRQVYINSQKMPFLASFY